MESITLTALGTTWWIEIFDTKANERRDVLTTDITSLLRSIESRFSRFRNDSLVGLLNAERIVITNDQDFKHLIALGQEMFEKTHGAFNILIGDALIARGYDSSYSFTDRDMPIIIGNPLTDISINGDEISLEEGALDLGGLGKGWAIDEVANYLINSGIKYFLINGGGDIYGTSDKEEPLTVYLEHPTETDTYLGTVKILNQGFAASSTHKRKWRTKIGEFNHIVGAKNIDTSFVIAPSATYADILATTILITTAELFNHVATELGANYAYFDSKSEKMNWSKGFPFSPLT